MGPQIIVSVHEPVEIPKPHKIGFGVCSFRSMRLLKQESLFWGFEWDKRSDNPEKNNNRGVEVSLNIFCEARKHVKNERD